MVCKGIDFLLIFANRFNIFLKHNYMYTLKPPVNATILALQHVLKLCLFKLRCKL